MLIEFLSPDTIHSIEKSEEYFMVELEMVGPLPGFGRMVMFSPA
jgi:hypothetical protein